MGHGFRNGLPRSSHSGRHGDRKAEGGAKERERRRQERDIYKTS